jgi:hypothetical protein
LSELSLRLSQFLHRSDYQNLRFLQKQQILREMKYQMQHLSQFLLRC